MGDTSGVDGIDLYADVEDFNEDLDASGNAGGNAGGSNPGTQFIFCFYIAWLQGSLQSGNGVLWEGSVGPPRIFSGHQTNLMR